MSEAIPLDTLREYYAGRGLEARVAAALAPQGPAPLGLEVLAPVDQNHVGGVEATRQLAGVAALAAGMRVLDAGSALGGPARLLAGELGCRVVGLDLSLEFCAVAAGLNARAAVTAAPRFVCGSSLEAPFRSGAFDVVWTQHATMNVADKCRLFDEFARVLRRDGRLVLHEMVEGRRQPIRFPVPWADRSEVSALAPAGVLRAAIEGASFEMTSWVDHSQAALGWFKGQAGSGAGSLPTGVDLVFGAAGPAIRRNVVRNLLEGRIAVVQAIARRP
jgi:SAM-dependent methyltransferase